MSIQNKDKKVGNNFIFFTKPLDKHIHNDYNTICSVRGSGGIGRRARLRGVCLRRTGSSPVSRTNEEQVARLALLFLRCSTGAPPQGRRACS